MTLGGNEVDASDGGQVFSLERDLIVSARFTPEGSIWGRVDADALILMKPCMDTLGLDLLLKQFSCLGVFLVGQACLRQRRLAEALRAKIGPRRRSGAPSRRAPEHQRAGVATARFPPRTPQAANAAGDRRRRRVPVGRRRSQARARARPGPEPVPRASPRAADVQGLRRRQTEPEPVPVAESRAISRAGAQGEDWNRSAGARALEQGGRARRRPEGEIVARVLEHLNEPHLLPIFEAEEINDNVLPCLDPSDLMARACANDLPHDSGRALGRQEQARRRTCSTTRDIRRARRRLRHREDQEASDLRYRKICSPRRPSKHAEERHRRDISRWRGCCPSRGN